MEDKAKRDYLDVLQVFRGIAALMVVCHHAIGSLRFYHQMDYPFFTFIGSIGKYGVDFFFVLSGFIITYSAYSSYTRPNAFRSYIKNRLLRIYVPYLPVGLLIFILYTCLPQFSNSERNISTLTSLTLLPDGNPALSVAWTLTFELCFYFLFSISFFSRKMWNGFVVLWLVIILAYSYTPLKSIEVLQNPFTRVFFSAYNTEFISGYLLALLILKKRKISMKLVVPLLTVSVATFIYCIVERVELFYFAPHYLFAISTFLIIYLAVIFRPGISKTALLMLVGNATYSIYLLHNPLQMIIIRMYPKINSATGFVFALLLVLVITSLIGYLYYLLFEKYAIRKIKAVV